MSEYFEVPNTPYIYRQYVDSNLKDLQRRVKEMRLSGSLSPQVLQRISKFFRIKGIYHSNAIEGNSLTIGETRMVVEMGLTLSGKSLRDQAEAANLSHALDFMEELASGSHPLTVHNIRSVHQIILKNIDDDNAGRYRTSEVIISGSQYKPPAPETIPIEMNKFDEWLQQISKNPSFDPIVIASAAHLWFVTIHPFIDGNGRTARILMNLLLMRSGYPICIISRDDRSRYYDALEEGQGGGDLSSLIELIYENVEESLEEWEQAAAEQTREQEWLSDITRRFARPAEIKLRNEYELWTNAMELLLGYFKRMAQAWNEQTQVAHVSFRDFGMLSFEKYVSLLNGETAKKTWFFRMDFESGGIRARYLFFFGYGNALIKSRAPVVLIIARELETGDYERLEYLSASNVPSIHQIGFDIQRAVFVGTTSTRLKEGRVEDLGRGFLEEVVKMHFSG